MKHPSTHQPAAEIQPVLIIVIAAIALGSGFLAWEWHSMHPAKEKHAGLATHHHHPGKSHHAGTPG